jgi:glycosyltransferase involved in cell wall biosynthesis
MRIGFLTPEFVTERYFSGGLANYVYRISRALVSRGHEVHVITFSENAPETFDYKGIWLHRINNNETMVSWLNRLSFSKLRSSMKLLALSWGFYKKLKELHRRHPFDLVQYSNYNSGGLVSSLLLDVPFLLRISTYTPVWHECLGVKHTPDMRTVEWMERLQLRVSRNIYAPSTTLKRMLEEHTSARSVGVVRTPFLSSPNHGTARFMKKRFRANRISSSSAGSSFTRAFTSWRRRCRGFSKIMMDARRYVSAWIWQRPWRLQCETIYRQSAVSMRTG